jgi:hypothetical protein
VTTTYRLTRESARASGSWYSDARIAELVPLGGLSPAEVAALDIPLADRRRALIRSCGMGATTQALFARMCAISAHTARLIAAAAMEDGAVYAAYAAESAEEYAEYGDGVGAAIAAVDAARAAVPGRPAELGAAVVEAQIRTLVALMQGAEH